MKRIVVGYVNGRSKNGNDYCKLNVMKEVDPSRGVGFEVDSLFVPCHLTDVLVGDVVSIAGEKDFRGEFTVDMEEGIKVIGHKDALLQQVKPPTK